MLNKVLGRELLEKAIASLPQEQRIALIFSDRPFVELASLILGDRMNTYLSTESEEECINIALESIINFVKSLGILSEYDEIEDIIQSFRYEDIKYKDKSVLFYEMNNAVLGLYHIIKANISKREDRDKSTEDVRVFSNLIKRKIDDQL